MKLIYGPVDSLFVHPIYQYYIYTLKKHTIYFFLAANPTHTEVMILDCQAGW